MKQKNKRVCITLSPEVYARISALAGESTRTVPGYIRHLVTLHLREGDSKK